MVIDRHCRGARCQSRPVAGTVRSFRLANSWMIDLWVAGALSMTFAAVDPVFAAPSVSALPTGGAVSGALSQK
mgnify:FL=1